MTPGRLCSRSACRRPAFATLTYVYADQQAVLGPLATVAEPHSYDLCELHAERLSAPRRWDLIRLAVDPGRPAPTDDDLVKLADAVREAARPVAPTEPTGRGVEVGRRGHLRVLRSADV